MEQQHDRHATFDPLVRRLIRASARGVIDSTGCPRYEQEDVQQDLMLHYWVHRDSYRSDRGARSTFAKVVIRRKAAALAIRARARRRSGVHVSIGPNELPDFEPNTAEARRFDACVVAAGRADDALHDLHLDVRRAIGRLSKSDRLLARRLMQSSITEIVKATGIPRSTIYDRIKSIRQSFVSAGLCSPRSEVRTVLDPTE